MQRDISKVLWKYQVLQRTVIVGKSTKVSAWRYEMIWCTNHPKNHDTPPPPTHTHTHESPPPPTHTHTHTHRPTPPHTHTHTHTRVPPPPPPPPPHTHTHESPPLPSTAHMRQRIGSALVQIMDCRLFCAKPLSKTMLGYCQLDP